MQNLGFIIWLTGLSGAGKSTIASSLAPILQAHGLRVEVLDGDVVRTHLSQGLSFSREDRDINVRRIGWVAALVARHGGVAVAAVISPFRNVREELKSQHPNFIEVYVNTNIDECARRDVKGLYAKAFNGEILNFTGVSDPYEPPLHPDVSVDTEKLSVEEGVGRIVEHLIELGLLNRVAD